jgi:DNA repair exonuclease SbcCD ATPase subunit
MIIQKIHINSFGPAIERDYNLESGINVVEGKNESGKTTIAMFIKFVLYGLGGRATEGGLSERKKYVNWKKGTFSLWIGDPTAKFIHKIVVGVVAECVQCL